MYVHSNCIHGFPLFQILFKIYITYDALYACLDIFLLRMLTFCKEMMFTVKLHLINYCGVPLNKYQKINIYNFS